MKWKRGGEESAAALSVPSTDSFEVDVTEAVKDPKYSQDSFVSSGDDLAAPPKESKMIPLSTGLMDNLPDNLDPDTIRRVKNLRRLTKILDSSIRVPMTTRTIGLDPIIGLLPLVGDAAGLVIGSVVIAIAAKYNVPKRTITIMLVNQGIDCIVGVVPFAGDLFDCAWKANAKNLSMVERHLVQPDILRRQSNKVWYWVIGIIVTFVIINCIIAGLLLWGIIALATK